MFISLLICVAMLTNCNKAEQKNDLVLTSDEIVSFNVTRTEIVSCEVEDAFRKWVHDRLKGDEIVSPNVTRNEIVSCEMEEAFRKWVHDRLKVVE